MVATSPGVREIMDDKGRYRQHAADCRALAKYAASEAQRKLLLILAANWDARAEGQDALTAKRTQE